MTNKKTDFNHIVNIGVEASNKKAEVKEAKSQFKEFQSIPCPKIVDAYVWEDKEVLIQVFKYTPRTDSVDIQINASGDSSALAKVRYFSIAKVLATGPDSKYKKDDIVKLRDIETMSIENSKWKHWVDNPMSKSNAKQKGEEPQRYVNNIYQTLGPHTFLLNPFDLESIDQFIDDGIYKLTDSKIENKIQDVSILLD